MNKIEQMNVRHLPYTTAQATAKPATPDTTTDQDTSAVLDIGKLTLTMAEKMDLDVKFVHNVIDTVLDVLTTREFWEGVIKATTEGSRIGSSSEGNAPIAAAMTAPKTTAKLGSNRLRDGNPIYSTTAVDDLIQTPEEAYEIGYSLGYKSGYGAALEEMGCGDMGTAIWADGIDYDADEDNYGGDVDDEDDGYYDNYDYDGYDDYEDYD